MSREKEVTRIFFKCERSKEMGWILKRFPIFRRFLFIRFPFYLKRIEVELDGKVGEVKLKFENDHPKTTDLLSDEFGNTDFYFTRPISSLTEDLLKEGLFTGIERESCSRTCTVFVFKFKAVNGEKFTETAMNRVLKLTKTLFGHDTKPYLSTPYVHRVTRRWTCTCWQDYGDVIWYKILGVYPDEKF